MLPRYLCLLAALLSGCATPRQLVIDPAPSREAGDTEQLPALYQPKPSAVLQGKASYYWKPQPTASGERFNPKKLTAAHKSLPMHSVIRVINLKNGKSVIVRINDRGPYVRGRIIDLSMAAAERIEMTKSGVVSVKVEVLKKIGVITKPNRKSRRVH
ncbi:MAG: septal ring lytic transglycosylase RlpA family protein [Verrucomicrobiae bacterium]